MRQAHEVAAVLAMVSDGLTTDKIARTTGIPRWTVVRWRRGRLPHSYLDAQVDGGCELCGGSRHDFLNLPEADYTSLLGLYLGDGHITLHRRGVHRLMIYLDVRYRGIIDECRDAMASVVPSSRVHVYERPQGHNLVRVSSYSKGWPCLLPQHGAGRKHERRIEFTHWQHAMVKRNLGLLLRGLIHSDGCRVLNRVRGAPRAYPRYLFSNASSDIRGIFCDACDALAIEWRPMNERVISVARRASVAELDRHVGPKT